MAAFALLLLASVMAGGASAECTGHTSSSGQVTCLTPDEAPSWMGSYFSTGNPCFKYSGNPYCVTSFDATSVNIGTCDCSNIDCGCACTGGSSLCLGSQDMDSSQDWTLAYFDLGGDPCINFSWGRSCFTFVNSTTAYVSSCDCGIDACGCDSASSSGGDDTTTTESSSSGGDDTTTTTESSSSGGDAATTTTESSGGTVYCDFAYDKSPDCTADKAKYCTSTYQRTIKNVLYENTMCDYCGVDSSNCYQVCDRGLAEADKTEIVNKHNELRSRVANGNENLGNPGPQPKATNMFELSWDEGLAETAQRWADQCVRAHDKNRIRDGYLSFPYVGQNNAYAWSSVKSSAKGLSAMVQGWYDEVKDWPNTNIALYSEDTPTKVPEGTDVGHYTQVVWAETKKVGCGYMANYDTDPFFAKYPYRKILICNYGPGGNAQYDPPSLSMYTEGSATGSDCTTKLANGLCQA